MERKTLEEIEHAITALPPHQLAELYAWLDRQRQTNVAQPEPTVFEKGLGLFGSPEDSALIDDVVRIAYEERKALPATAPPN